jgi:hypothetical protein
MEDHDHHVHTEFAGRCAWLLERAPDLPKGALAQLAWLYPVAVVPKAAPGIYLDRVSVLPAAVACKDEQTKVRYVVLTWPASGTGERMVRLYVDLPSGEAFLAEKPISKASIMLDLHPSLPFFVKDGVRDFIRRHTPPAKAA